MPSRSVSYNNGNNERAYDSYEKRTDENNTDEKKTDENTPDKKKRSDEKKNTEELKTQIIPVSLSHEYPQEE